MNIGFSLDDIKDMTTPEVNLYIQRHNEPIYKEELDHKLRTERQKEEGRTKNRIKGYGRH